MSFKGKTVRVETKAPFYGLPLGPYEPFHVEDLWINVSGGTSWGDMRGNPACMGYAVRSAFDPDIAGNEADDDKVYYGKYNGLGYLVHESEMKEIKQNG